MNVCDNEFEGSNGACLVNDCTFHNSRAGSKGGVMAISQDSDSPARNTLVEINRCTVVNSSCGQVSNYWSIISGTSIRFLLVVLEEELK